MNQPPTMSKCPDAETLTKYVSGSLVEATANELSEHLGQCDLCRQRVDEMVAEPDSLINAIRQSPVTSESRSSKLDKLIDTVENLDPTRLTRGRRRRADGPVSLEEFIDCLSKSELMTATEVAMLAESIAAPESSSFARELIARKLLTPYQARALMRGRWKGLVLGNYVILDKLGQGGMGLVFKARHKRMERIVCLKVLDSSGRKSPEVLERFRKEAQTVAALSHSNIVVAHDADEADGVPYLVMEYVQGSDLAKHVLQHGPLEFDKVVSLVHQVALALDYAHGEGVVHRDVKPHNLLLEDSGAVKVLDMGLARFDSYLGRSPDATTHTSMTTTGVVMGTVDYMSPEQALNSRNADSRSDIYSLGCTLFFLLTGRVMFEGETAMEKLIAHREQNNPRLSEFFNGIPIGLEAIFQKMVAKQPRDRYQSMSELADDLQAFLNGGDPTIAMQSFVNGVRSRDEQQSAAMISKRTLWWSGAVIAAMCVASVAYWRTRPTVSTTVETSNPAAPNALAAVTSSPTESPTRRVTSEVSKPKTEPRTPEPEPPKPEPPKGHPLTLANGGPGRVLVVIPHDWFYEDGYVSIAKALRKRGIDMQTASSKPDYAQPKHNKIKPVALSMRLPDFKVIDFDAVIFLGGNVGEFTHKGPAGKEAQRIIRESLQGRRVVASVSDGRRALDDAGATKECRFSFERGCSIARAKGLPGTIITVEAAKHSHDLVALIFDEALQD